MRGNLNTPKQCISHYRMRTIGVEGSNGEAGAKPHAALGRNGLALGELKNAASKRQGDLPENELS
jgi:hypothetical protein